MNGKDACNCLMWIAATPPMYFFCIVITLVGDNRLHGEGERQTDSSSGGIAITTLAIGRSLDVPKLQAVWIPHV